MVKLINKIINILKGTFFNLFKKNEDVSKKRLAICNKCKLIQSKPIIGNVCGECGCILESKTRVKDEHCDLNKW